MDYQERRKGMKSPVALFALLSIASFAVVGCSSGDGTTGGGFAAVTGIVTDVDGNVIRNARVFNTDDGTIQTRSNSSGAFTLTGVPEGISRIQADLTVAGVKYYGQNYIDTFANERSKSLNIVIGRADQMATLQGQVTDRTGNAIAGARVYANVNGLGSYYGNTDENGKYKMSSFIPGVTYEVYATGRGFNSDHISATFNARQTQNSNFQLSNGGNPLLPAPENLTAVAWTSPRVATSKNMPSVESAKSALSAFIDKKKHVAAKTTRVASKTRDTSGGNWIEVDLSWDPSRNDAAIGYGIYRGTSANGATTGIEFVRDTLTSFFADSDKNLAQNKNYYYEITALNTQYPDTDNSESDFSNRYGVQTLGDLTLRAVTQGPLRFNWNSAVAATDYTVFVFADYPNIGVSPVWPQDGDDTEFNAATTTSTSLNYAGPALTRGRTYYYVVLGHANNLDSRTISVVGSFVAN